MAATVAFADVLDEALRVPPIVQAGLDRIVAGPRPVPPAAFAFAHAWRQGLGPGLALSPSRAPIAPEAPEAREAPEAPGAPEAPEAPDLDWLPFRRVPVLTGRQRAAVEVFRDHGAALPVDFTRADLRSAYRRLARRFHPDRHAASGTAHQDRLARTFAGLSDAYQALLAVRH